jgi:hypothetical protein
MLIFSSKDQPDKVTNLILIISGLLLFSYTVARAYFVSFTFDESTSYLEYVRKGIIIPTHFNGGDANNHLINTWLMEFFSWLLGTSDFVLRLPNLLAHIVYLIYSAKLVKNLSSYI